MRSASFSSSLGRDIHTRYPPAYSCRKSFINHSLPVFHYPHAVPLCQGSYRASSGACPYCRRGHLCVEPHFTGYDVDGGYAEYMTAPEDFIYPMPTGVSSRESCPLLVRGHYRLSRTAPPQLAERRNAGSPWIRSLGAHRHPVSSSLGMKGLRVHAGRPSWHPTPRRNHERTSPRYPSRYGLLL